MNDNIEESYTKITGGYDPEARRGTAVCPLPPFGPNPAQAIHIRFARSLISILRCSYFIEANKTDSWIWEMHNEYRIYGWRRTRSSALRGYVAGNLIAVFVTGADGNFNAVIIFFRHFIQFDSILCFIVCLPGYLFDRWHLILA